MAEEDYDLLMLRFFYEQKGDLERFVGFDEARASGKYPELFAAWDRFKDARRRVELELMAADRVS